MASWPALGDWWQAEVAGDHSYEEVVTPLLIDVLQPALGSVYLDLGCGTGRVMPAVAATGAIPVGVELVPGLAKLAASHAPTVVDTLPNLASIADDAVDGAYAVLVLEHLEDAIPFFESASRVVRTGGVLALVSNHPFWTAPGSTPITDDDGEILWRPGGYFDAGAPIDIPAGEESVTFYHRTTAELLGTAAGSGWSLENIVELPHHDLTDQAGIPRLIACRWHLLP